MHCTRIYVYTYIHNTRVRRVSLRFFFFFYFFWSCHLLRFSAIIVCTYVIVAQNVAKKKNRFIILHIWPTRPARDQFMIRYWVLLLFRFCFLDIETVRIRLRAKLFELLRRGGGNRWITRPFATRSLPTRLPAFLISVSARTVPINCSVQNRDWNLLDFIRSPVRFRVFFFKKLRFRFRFQFQIFKKFQFRNRFPFCYGFSAWYKIRLILINSRTIKRFDGVFPSSSLKKHPLFHKSSNGIFAIKSNLVIHNYRYSFNRSGFL